MDPHDHRPAAPQLATGSSFGQLGSALSVARSYHSARPAHTHEHHHPRERHVAEETSAAGGDGYRLRDLREDYDEDLLYTFYEYARLCVAY